MEKVIMQTSYTDTGYCCMCKQIPGWTASGSKDFGKFQSYVQESIDIWLEWKREDGETYPSVFDGEYQIVYQFDVRALLNYYLGTLSFAGLQKITGINQKQLANYAAGRSHPRREQAKKIQDGLHRLGEELSTVTLWF